MNGNRWRLHPGLKVFHVVFPPQYFRACLKIETHGQLKQQVTMPIVPVTKESDILTVSGLGFCGQYEDEKNSEKISSLDFFVLFYQEKRT